jgi:hypothetical protein
VARGVFAGLSTVTIRHGDWSQLRAFGPFALLALDGGGQGKGAEAPLCPREWLRPGGTLIMDDFTPAQAWPPTRLGRPDTARLYWLQHPDLLATEVRTQPDAAAIIATFKG